MNRAWPINRNFLKLSITNFSCSPATWQMASPIPEDLSYHQQDEWVPTQLK